jgi:hypothetical protein
VLGTEEAGDNFGEANLTAKGRDNNNVYFCLGY